MLFAVALSLNLCNGYRCCNRPLCTRRSAADTQREEERLSKRPSGNGINKEGARRPESGMETKFMRAGPYTVRETGVVAAGEGDEGITRCTCVCDWGGMEKWARRI